VGWKITLKWEIIYFNIFEFYLSTFLSNLDDPEVEEHCSLLAIFSKENNF